MSVMKVVTGMSMVLAIMAGTIEVTHAVTDTRKEMKAAKSKPFIRGGIVYRNYCVLCHGHRADGMGRATRLYGAANLVISAAKYEASDEFFDKIIRGGGASVGASRYMPGYGEELTDNQIKDVIAYLNVVNDPVGRGEAIFKTNCILCHGVKGDGNGRASKLYDPRPANLTRSDKNDDYKRMIITMGGAAMGRSSVMPQWGLQLKDYEISDLVVYLRTILVKPESK